MPMHDSDTDDLDFAMLTPPTRPGPCKAEREEYAPPREVKGGRETTLLKVGDRVEAGTSGTRDYASGKVLNIKNRKAQVAWDSGATTWERCSYVRKAAV